MLNSVLMAQNVINSPYSRYGLGEMRGENVNAQIKGMGGISLGLSNSTMINPSNPASYAVFDSLSFLIEAGIDASFVTLKTDQRSESSQTATLGYVLMGFPITKWWKTSIGILPYSKIGYNVEIVVDMSEYEFSDILNKLEGSGGINRILWGNAFNIGKNLRIGIDSYYIFGNGSRNSTIYFLDSLNIYGTKVETSTRGNDFIFNYGMQYDIHFSEKNILTLGLIYANKFNVNANRKYLSKTITGGFYDVVEEVKDTVKYIPDIKGTFIIPPKFGFGAVYQKQGSWLVGVDFEWQKWSDYESFGVLDSLRNTMRFAIGGQYTPDHTNISSLFKRMTYRGGVRYEQTYLSLNGHNVDEFGISFGVTFPMKKSKTTIDLAIEAGKRGTTADKLVQEGFFNFVFGVSIQEHWFYKRKYN